MPKKPKKDVGENNQEETNGTPTASPISTGSGDQLLDDFVAHVLKHTNKNPVNRKK